ncbi:hypothetical protein BD779DRAFT_1479384 [Infundibulicybe gibba]|nr:hypothetical protein BD779DRAFT_1479384 [Infundibulicybe gibba]
MPEPAMFIAVLMISDQAGPVPRNGAVQNKLLKYGNPHILKVDPSSRRNKGIDRFLAERALSPESEGAKARGHIRKISWVYDTIDNSNAYVDTVDFGDYYRPIDTLLSINAPRGFEQYLNTYGDDIIYVQTKGVARGARGGPYVVSIVPDEPCQLREEGVSTGVRAFELKLPACALCPRRRCFVGAATNRASCSESERPGDWRSHHCRGLALVHAGGVVSVAGGVFSGLSRSFSVPVGSLAAAVHIGVSVRQVQ